MLNPVIIKDIFQGAWVAQLVKRPTWAQVMISVCGFEFVLGSVLTAQSLEPASDSVSLSLPLPHSCSDTLTLSKIKINKKKKLKRAYFFFFHFSMVNSLFHHR